MAEQQGNVSWRQVWEFVKEHAPALPVLHWLPKYTRANLTSDLVAGFTVGTMVVPQSSYSSSAYHMLELT
jgi:MFS superfamily sulfate permease-like transporter